MEKERLSENERKREELHQKIQKMTDNDILNLINKAFIFNEKPRLIFYSKDRNKISGYLEIDNKLLVFEIWFSVIYNEISIIIGKATKVLKGE